MILHVVATMAWVATSHLLLVGEVNVSDNRMSNDSSVVENSDILMADWWKDQDSL